MKQKKSCSNCMKGIPLPVNRDILCREKGIVSPDFSCRGHRFMPEEMSANEERLKCIDCEYFLLGIDAHPSGKPVGICQMFTVRQYDGSNKNACSRFVKKKVAHIS